MKKVLLFIGVLACCALGVVAVQHYQSANAGRLLAEEFFDPRPPTGYGTQRVLTPTASPDAAASILNQAIRYHQQADYDLSLTAFRAYFADNPSSEDPLPAVLAASAAMASGAYETVPRFLEELPREHPAKRWLQALLALRDEDFKAAEEQLSLLQDNANNPYPVAALMRRLP